MATKQWFEYVNPETGRKEFECPALQGQSILAKQISSASGMADEDMRSTANVTVWAALCADVKGHKVLPRGVRRTTDVSAFVQKMADAVDAGYVIDFNDKYTILFRSEDVDDKGAGGVDENPTGSSLEFS